MPACPSCGGTIARTDSTCSYCGSDNPAYRPVSADIDAMMAGAMGALQTGNYTAAGKLYRQIIQDDPEIYWCVLLPGALSEPVAPV
ncbi:MAG: hypothetical protein HC914_08835 [Chloroflexaceae bacterium]|nr:hypothetical protein [Chloroflexaceae bacterium]